MVRSLIPWTGRLPLTRFEEMEDLVDRFFGPDQEWLRPKFEFLPSVNVAETDNLYEVTVELPGMKPEDINVELKGGQLWISGEKKEEKEEKWKTFRRLERRYGEFRRLIPLPGTVDDKKIEANYEEGVLKIHVPKTEEAKVKHIKVT